MTERRQQNKAKAAPAPAPQPENCEKSLTDCVNDDKFLQHIRQCCVTVAEQDEKIVTGRASVLINNLSDEELKDIVDSCLAEGQGGGTDAATQPQDCHPHPKLKGVFDGDWQGKITDFINNMDPAVKRMIVERVLTYLGLIL